LSLSTCFALKYAELDIASFKFGTHLLVGTPARAFDFSYRQLS